MKKSKVYYGWVIVLVGTLPFGITFDVFGGYQEILLLSISLPLLASALSFASKAPRYK